MTHFQLSYSEVLPQQGYDTLVGLIIIGGIALTGLALFYKIDKLRKDRKTREENIENNIKKKYEEELVKREQQIKERLELTRSLSDLRISNERLSDSICSLNESIKIRFQKLEEVVDSHSSTLTKVAESTSSAHKRLNEHLQFEHHSNRIRNIDATGNNKHESED